LKVLALDFGSARTGVAVSDPTGTLARPMTTIQRATTDAGFAELLAVIAAEEPELVVVGMPLTLRGEHGEQARATDAFVARLRAAIAAPVETYDERFTSVLADGDDARAAAHLLSGYLERWQGGRA
jgi:putative Holliday junction resolvase